VPLADAPDVGFALINLRTLLNPRQKKVTGTAFFPIGILMFLKRVFKHSQHLLARFI
jgi:hypothetical protein